MDNKTSKAQDRELIQELSRLKKANVVSESTAQIYLSDIAKSLDNDRKAIYSTDDEAGSE